MSVAGQSSELYKIIRNRVTDVLVSDALFLTHEWEGPSTPGPAGNRLHAPDSDIFSLFCTLLTIVIVCEYCSVVRPVLLARNTRDIPRKAIEDTQESILETLERSGSVPSAESIAEKSPRVLEAISAILVQIGWPSEYASVVAGKVLNAVLEALVDMDKQEMGRCDIGVLVALKEEFSVFLDLHQNIEPVYEEDHAHYYYRYTHPSGVEERPFKCVTTYIGGMGTTKAASLTEKMISRWKPNVIVTLGIAASLHPDVLLGDVVIATQIDEYMASVRAEDVTDERPEGAQTSEFELVHAGDVHPVSVKLVNHVSNLEFAHRAAHEQWRSSCGVEKMATRAGAAIEQLMTNQSMRDSPCIIEAHVASGPIVGASTSFTRWLQRRDRSVKALEMESAGAAFCASARGTPIAFLAVRGISDFGDARKAELDKIGKGIIRAHAMRNASGLISTLLASGALSAELGR